MFCLAGMELTSFIAVSMVLCLSFEARLGEFGVVQERRLQGDLSAAFQYIKGAYKKDRRGLFASACIDRVRNNHLKLNEGRFRSDIRKKFFTMSVVRY